MAALNANMKQTINALIIILLFVLSDMESANKIESVVIPILMFLAIGVFIYKHYKKRGHDDTPSNPGSGYF